MHFLVVIAQLMTVLAGADGSSETGTPPEPDGSTFWAESRRGVPLPDSPTVLFLEGSSSPARAGSST